MENDLFDNIFKATKILEESPIPIDGTYGVISYEGLLYIIEDGKITEVMYE